MKAIICGGGTVGHLTPGISIAEIIKNNEKKLNKNYTDEEIETAINEAKAMFVKKEVVNIDFGKDNQQLSGAVSQPSQQPPVVDKK